MSSVKIQGSATGTAVFTIAIPDGTSTDRTLTLPDSAATFATVDSRDAMTALFRINPQTVTANTTIAATENACATGPLAVASGVTLTVASGGRLAIV